MVSNPNIIDPTKDPKAIEYLIYLKSKGYTGWQVSNTMLFLYDKNSKTILKENQ